MVKKSLKGQQGLRDIVQTRLLNDVLQNSCDKWSGWMVLIVDPPSLRVLSSAVGMYDLMERRVTLVEDLVKERAPFRDMGAIYLLTPTKQSIDRLLRDWTPSENQKEPRYGNAVFLYFLGRLPDNLLAMIKTCKPLLKRVKALGEVNIDFLTKEDRAFHLDMKKSFRYLFPHRNTGKPTPVEMVICDKLVTLCATLNEYPHIRFRSASPLCTSLANVFHRKMTEFIGGNENWWYHGDANHTSRGRSTLLLFDRSDDCLSPLMHEFTYQAMVNDLLPIEEDRITYKSETIGTGDGAENKSMDKDVLLNEKDQVWVELRGKHIADVIQILSNRIREMVNSSTSQVAKSKGTDTKALSLSQMANALKALPEYREVMDKLSQHMHLSHQCMDIFNKKGLLDLSEVEQTLATGKTEEGRVPKLNELVDMTEEQLQSTEDSQIRLRLLAILIVSQKGIRPSDRDRLLAAARLSPPEQRVLNNLEKMGCPMIQQPGQQGGKGFASMFGGQKAAQSGREESESEYSSARYVCVLKTIMQDMMEGKLSMDDYPSVLPMPAEGASSGTATTCRVPTGSARKGGATTSRWAKKETKAKPKSSFSGGRKILFAVGGMCYSELRAMHEVMESGDTEFILGSTRFINPRQFLQDLSTLG
mmetsp:Transcript_26886/g.79458  ORF Transcript_26886/g.79458 Transcript_26886/m.79458 type:complete len:645 (-) Transcript_26886:151-2085(-)|eukprot:CAMPEP_0113556108 /NCGR_PEP_ID=MMETSP0015_2-20120614/17078_1 /TAXON_ID=2838 /ORGANISM="Odontella" /LENGTH=644 /DNA_ID=CAMNT_0000457437 /DNA_START=222 /DNA_END=2156 /DNA_ORIENTATION=- /assembly_acc=CAM_ASM_000160